MLAKWLATEPKVLILDAPTVGVDVGARAGIFEIVRSLAEAGMAILLISDEIPEVYFNADRVLHMRGGRLVGKLRAPRDRDRRDRGGGPCLAPARAAAHRGLAGRRHRRSVARCSASPPTPSWTLANLVDLLNISAINLIFAVGLLVVLVAGGIDISFAVAASVVQYLDRDPSTQSAAATGRWASCSPAPFGFALGAINAALIYYFRIISIVVTIATFNLFFGFLMFLTGGVSIYDLPDWWRERMILVESETRERRSRAHACPSRS